MAFERVCSVSGCNKPFYARSYCKSHYSVMLAKGVIQRKPPRTCSVDGCEKKHAALGFCRTHVWRFRKYGDPLITTRLVRYDCSVPGCEAPHFSKGYCSKHLRRFELHGDPTFTRETLKEFIDRYIIGYREKYCFFLLSRSPYVCIKVDGVLCGAHRYVCEATHGKPPSSEHLACHKCGNGHLNCISPNCLYWGTYADNNADRLLHGTHNRGERQPWAQLTEADVRQIRELHRKMPPQKLAELYGVSRSTINNIHFRRSWKWLVD